MTLFHLWLIRYGYAALFSLLMLGVVGVPVPDELLLLFAGYNARQGNLHLALTLLFGAAGSMCGITLSFLIGRYVGVAVIHRFGRFLHLTEPRMARTHDWFERWGKWTLVFGYFVPGFRHLTAIVAGTGKLPWRHFAPFAYSGAMLWSASFIVTGYLLGPDALKLAEVLPGYLLFVTAGVAIVVVAILLANHFRRSSSRP